MTLPDGWAETRLGDVCDLLNGRAYKKQELLSQGKYPVLRVGNFFTSDKWYYSDLELEAEKYCDNGDLLYAWSASFGPRIWAGDKVIYHYHIWRTRLAVEALNKQFLFRWFEWDKENIKAAHGTGTTMIHVTKGDMEDRLICLPPLMEQRRIVAKLDALTARLARARAELDRVPVLAENLRAAAVTEAFRGTATIEYRAQSMDRAPDDEHLASRYEVVAGRARRKPAAPIDWQPEISIPSSWRWVSVDQVIARAQYGSSSKTSEEPGVAVLRMGNIQGGRIDFNKLKYLPPEHDEFPELFLEPGDVIFNRTNSLELVGKSAVFLGADAHVSFASYLIRVQCCAIRPRLLAYYLNSAVGRQWVAAVASQQVGQANVNGTKLRGLGIPLPPEGEQAEMEAWIDNAFTRADRMEVEAARARALLDRLEAAILGRAFRGELVAQDPNDEPASVPLDRIRAERAERAAAPRQKRGRRTKAG